MSDIVDPFDTPASAPPASVGIVDPFDTAAPHVAAAPAAPVAPLKSSMGDVATNAAYGGATGVADSLLNTPTNIWNLGKAGVGWAATALGRPDLAPELTKNPDFARRLVEKLGLTKPGVVPQGFAQKAVDAITRGGVGGALTGGRSLAESALGAGMGALSTASGEAAGEAGKKIGLSESGQNALAAAAGIAAPAGAAKIGGGMQNVDPDVRKLTSEGVKLTPGQIIGGGTRRVEDSIAGIPFVGDVIKSAQRRSLESFGTAAMNRALAPIGEKLPAGLKGNDAIAHVQDTLGDAYDSVLSRMKGSLDGPAGNGAPQITGPGGTPPVTLRGELATIKSMGQNLPSPQREQLDRIIQNEIVDRFTSTGGLASGETLKNIESKLRVLSDDFQRSDNYDVRTMAGAVKEARAAVQRMLMRENPDQAPDLQKVNEGYANFKRLQRASSSVASDKGVFTAAQLHNAAKAGDKSKDKSQFARGGALMQDLTSAGKAVLPSKVPDSGTATRALVEAALAGGGTGALLGPGTAAAGLGGMAIYSPPVQALIQKALLSNNKPALKQAADRSIIPLSGILQNGMGGQ